MNKNDVAPSYSIVIPAFEEEKFIVSTLDTLHSYLKDNNIWEETEVIVVAAKGNDSTAELASSRSSNFKSFKVVEPGVKVGKGRDVKAGMAVATGKFKLFMDADLATPLVHLLPAFKLLESGTDVVIGERNLWKVHHLFKRRVISAIGNRIVRTLTGLPYGDTQCGFKGFSADVADVIFDRQTIDGWGFDIELLTIAKQHKYKVERMMITDWYDPKDDTGLVGESAWKASLKTFKEALKIRQNSKKGLYK